MSTEAKFLEVKSRGDTLIFQLGDGQRVEFNPEEASPAIRKAAMLHGFNQKIRDAAAGYSKVNDFGGAVEAMQGVVDALLEGSWNRKAQGTGLNRGDLAYAIAKIKGVSIERATAAVESTSEEQRKVWGKNAKVAALMAESRQKRLQAAADAAEAPEDLPDIV